MCFVCDPPCSLLFVLLNKTLFYPFTGLLWQLRPSDTEVELLAHTRNVVSSELELETGLETGWIQNGGLFIASNKQRLDEYKRLMSVWNAPLKNTINIWNLKNDVIFIACTVWWKDSKCKTKLQRFIAPACVLKMISNFVFQLGKAYGIESYVLSPAETKDLYPLMNVKDLYGTLYVPKDGTMDPAGTCTTLSRAATARGATVRLHSFQSLIIELLCNV